MTDRNLSPQAQAVLDATYREMDYAPRRHVQWAAAAALRAVVHHLAYETQLDDPMMTTIHVVDADDLDAIAAELEGA